MKATFVTHRSNCPELDQSPEKMKTSKWVVKEVGVNGKVLHGFPELKGAIAHSANYNGANAAMFGK